MTDETTEELDVIYGAKDIGAFIKKSERQAFYLLQKKLIPATKVGREYVASKARLRRHLMGEAE